MAKNIVLIGPPGSGKSLCGKLLAVKLGWPFSDTDELIEKSAGKTVSQIFSESGETHFRQLETNLLKQLADEHLSAQVIATGGGTPVPVGNFERLLSLGAIVYLSADLTVLVNRLQQETHRPLLASPGQAGINYQHEVEQRLCDLLSKRLPIYNQAQFKVDTSYLSEHEVVNQILTLLGL